MARERPSISGNMGRFIVTSQGEGKVNSSLYEPLHKCSISSSVNVTTDLQTAGQQQSGSIILRALRRMSNTNLKLISLQLFRNYLFPSLFAWESFMFLSTERGLGMEQCFPLPLPVAASLLFKSSHEGWEMHEGGGVCGVWGCHRKGEIVGMVSNLEQVKAASSHARSSLYATFWLYFLSWHEQGEKMLVHMSVERCTSIQLYPWGPPPQTSTVIQLRKK